MNRSSKTAGLTIIEVIVSISILVLVGIVIANFSRNLFFLNGVVSSGIIAQQEARQVLRQLAGELRSAVPSVSGAYPISVASSTQLTFFSDYDEDGTIEQITYYLENGTLKKAILKPSGNPPTYTGSAATSTIIQDIRNGTSSVFSYFPSTYAGTSSALVQPVDILTVRLVKVMVVVERDPYRSPTPISVTTQVSIRNLKDNL
jgi:type II secretory pathway component PulJ